LFAILSGVALDLLILMPNVDHLLASIFGMRINKSSATPDKIANNEDQSVNPKEK
jgi:hypothetical protein